MLKDAAIRANGVQRCFKAPTILAALVAPSSLDDSRELAPASAGRVRHDGPRAGIRARVSSFVPEFDIWQARIDSVSFDI